VNILSYGDKAIRNDNGRTVRVLDVRPNGVNVFYLAEDLKDGHTVIIAHKDLRPWYEKDGTR
jgi:hypothetical protein